MTSSQNTCDELGPGQGIASAWFRLICATVKALPSMLGFGSLSFSSRKHIPSLQGRVILITGGNTGLGLRAVLEYGRHGPSCIIVAARNLEKANEAVAYAQDQLKKEGLDAPEMRVVQLDLTSLASTSRAAEIVLQTTDRLDILMLNAGIMATAHGTTEDGYEKQFGVCHLGHAMLIRKLLPLVQKTSQISNTPKPRIVILSSIGQSMAPTEGILFDQLKTTALQHSAYTLYGQAKLANRLYAYKLAEEYPEIISTAVHPGIVGTDLYVKVSGTPLYALAAAVFGAATWFMSSLSEGVKTQLWASVSDDVVNGAFYFPIGVLQSGPDEKLKQVAQGLWEYTERNLEAFEGKDEFSSIQE